MKMRFLCCTHREELSKKPSQAINIWQNGFDTGKTLFEEEQWQDALPQLGCAFETAEIILTSRAVDASHASEIFTHSAILLARVFAELGHINQSFEILLLAVDRIEQELMYQPGMKAWYNTNLQTIYDAIDSPHFVKSNSASVPAQAITSANFAAH